MPLYWRQVKNYFPTGYDGIFTKEYFGERQFHKISYIISIYRESGCKEMQHVDSKKEKKINHTL